jgi:hypothetical protein
MEHEKHKEERKKHKPLDKDGANLSSFALFVFFFVLFVL